LELEIQEGMVSVETDESRIIVRIREKGSFPSGSAVLNPGFFDVLDRISSALGRSPGQLVVAGHTDDVPISTTRYRSNWELSSARAVTVVHALLENADIDPARVLVEGHADSNPLAPNDSADNRAKNRRVELILIRGEDQESGEQLDY
jgi:chemotaxis protein MotB